MLIYQFGERSRKGRRAVSTIVGAIIVLGMVLTIGYGYFYAVIQNEQSFTKIGLQSNLNSIQQEQEYLTVAGIQIGPSLGFIVNNTGIATTITSYFITDQSTGQMVQYNSGTSSTPALPYAISQGRSVTFRTAVLATPSHSYSVKLLTSRGSTFVGTYPSKQLGIQAVSALVAAGLGSVSMVFSSYDLYNVSKVGSQWVITVSQPYAGELVPYGITPAFSLKVTNNDPYAGTVTLDSHTEIYLYEPCPSGCGGNVPVFAYFLVNVAPNGTVTSTTKGSFAPVQIPYGTTTTLYFASSYDISLGSFATQSLSSVGNGDCNTKVACGEYDVFVIISGGDTQASGAILYSQNLPFAGTFLADNVAWFSQTPISCTHSISTQFSLYVTNSKLSQGNIIKVSLNASALSLVNPQAPPGWSVSGTSVIVWTPNSGHQVSQGETSPALTWSGTAPSSIGTQVVFPVTITFASGTVTAEQVATGCIVS